MTAQTGYLLRAEAHELREIGNAIKKGSYSQLKTWMKADKKDAIVDEVKKAQLRGRGGAGFPGRSVRDGVVVAFVFAPPAETFRQVQRHAATGPNELV